MEWKKKCKRITAPLANRKVWTSACGHYKVEECTITYGDRTERGVFLGYPTYYRAMVLKDWGWHIISTHRKRTAAKVQLEHYHEHGTVVPKKKKKRRAK